MLSACRQCVLSLSVLALVLVLVNSIAAYDAPGIMQVQVEGFFNPDGRDASGRCCLPPEDNSTANTCGGECRTFFRVCAAKVGPNWPEETDLRQHTLACPLGLLVTPTIANNSLEPRRDGLLLMRFPYREWPGKVKLVIEAWHDVTGQLFGRDPYDHPEEKVAKLIVRVERRHKLVFGDDWLRRSVRVSLPNRSPQRKANRRVTFTYALRLAGLPEPSASPSSTTSTSSTTTSTTTTTTTTTEAAPLSDDWETASSSDIKKVATSSSAISYTPINSVTVSDHSVHHATQKPFQQYTPIDGMFLAQNSNAYPLPQSVFTPSTTTTTSTTTAAPEKEYTLLENVFTPDQFSTTPSSFDKQTSAEDKFTPVGTFSHQPTTQAAESAHMSEPIPQPPVSSVHAPVVSSAHAPPHKFSYGHLGSLILPPNFPAHVAIADSAQQVTTSSAIEYTPVTGVQVSYQPGHLQTTPSTEAPYSPSITPPPTFPPAVTTTPESSESEESNEFTPLGGIHVVVSSTHKPSHHHHDEDDGYAPIHNVFASFGDQQPLVNTVGKYSAADKYPSSDEATYIPYSYPTTFMTEEVKAMGTEAINTEDDSTTSASEESDEVMISTIKSAIVEKSENGTESSVFSTMPVLVVEDTGRRNASATVILNTDRSSNAEEHEDESMDDLFEYAVYPNSDDFK